MSDETDPFEWSKVNQTNPSPYYQLVVQSQKMINNAFWNMWAIAEPPSPLLSVDITVNNIGHLVGKLDAPVVSLHVTSATPQLYFFVTLTSGTLTLAVDTAGNNKDWDVSTWAFAFPVAIGTDILNAGNSEYEAYKNKMGLEGNFSLAQLYINVSKTTEFDPSLSSFGTEDFAKEDDFTQQQFKDFVTGWLQQMASGQKTVVGVALQTDDPSSVNKNAPTFPPTSLDFSMYPWIDPSNPSGVKDNLDENALCYLMMTDNYTPPSPPNLPYSGTWVNAESNHQGLFCMNKYQFWEKWLLPTLKIVNSATEMFPMTPGVDANWTGGGSVTPRFYVGYNPNYPNPSDPFFDFFNDSSWEDGNLSSYNEDSSDLGAWWNHIQVWQYTNSYVYVVFDSGSQKISIKGKSHFTFTVKQTGATSGPWKTESTFVITSNWHLNFAVGVVSDGGLQIARIDDPPGEKACTTTGESQTSGIDWDVDWDTIVDQISADINGTFENNLGNVENELLYALQNQHKLFLPAGGTLLMQDTMFNSRGDLLATLHYNGDAPPGKKPTLPPYLSHLPPRKSPRPVVPRQKPSAPYSGPVIHIPAKEEPPVGGPPPADERAPVRIA